MVYKHFVKLLKKKLWVYITNIGPTPRMRVETHLMNSFKMVIVATVRKRKMFVDQFSGEYVGPTYSVRRISTSFYSSLDLYVHTDRRTASRPHKIKYLWLFEHIIEKVKRLFTCIQNHISPSLSDLIIAVCAVCIL